MSSMSKTTRFSYCLSMLAVCAATPALADVTAAELWTEWQTQGASQGQTLSAEEVVTTDTGLTLRGFTTTFSEDDVTSTGRAEELVMVENRDGTVSVTMSELYEIEVDFPSSPGEPNLNITLEMRHDGLNIVAGGTVDARTYVYTADEITISEGQLSGGGSAPPEVDMLIRMRDLDADYLIDGSDPDNIGFASSGTLAAFTGAMDVVPAPPEQGRFKANFAFSDLSSEGAGNLGSLTQLTGGPGSLPEGFVFDGRFDYAEMRYDMNFDDPGEVAFAMSYTNTGGGMGLAMSEERMTFDVTANGAEAQMTGSDIPVPISFSVGAAELVFDLPLAPGDAPQPFATRLAYQDVTMGEPIWSMFDPGQAIPRDLITVIADISGAAQMLVNLLEMDPDAMDAPPGELRELTINEVRISAGGAELTGTGDLEFAPGQIIPMPVGQVDLALSGGNALMGRLSAAGLLPAEQVMMMQGMTGVFARPGAAPDTLESTIQFTPGGGITANGMPLQ